MDARQPAVYILASRRNGTLYVGVTSALVKRIWEHRNDVVEGFTQRYGVHTLVYFEQHASMEAAITREKQLKKWNRSWKLSLIEEKNPDWQICGRKYVAEVRHLWMPACAGMTG